MTMIRAKKRWKEYFERFLNDGNPRLGFGDGVPNQDVASGISRDDN